jgi:hypothetical protein
MEYRNIGRAALASLLEINDARRIPLESDTLWSELEKLGNPVLMERVLRDNGVSFPFPSCSDYLCIVYWAEAMSLLAKMVVILLSPKEAGKIPALLGLRRAVTNVRSKTKPHFDQDWGVVVMTRASQIQTSTPKP